MSWIRIVEIEYHCHETALYVIYAVFHVELDMATKNTLGSSNLYTSDVIFPG